MRIALVVALAACGDDTVAIDAAPPVDAPNYCIACPKPGTVENRGAAPNALAEASGMVASRTHPGILYSHNDSGDTARIFALNDHGALVATLEITGANATNVDWEDIAVGPCAAGSCVYIGDIGDNNLVRDTKTIYAFVEPALSPTQAATTIQIADVSRVDFSYPDFKHNAETLLVHPTSGAIYVVSKELVGTASTVFKVPANPSGTVVLEKLATLPFPTGTDLDVSAGDISPDGTSVLLRLGTSRVYELDVAAGQPFDSVFAIATAPKCSLPDPAEPNGESITWNADGTGYFTISEGAGEQVHYVSCR